MKSFSKLKNDVHGMFKKNNTPRKDSLSFKKIYFEAGTWTNVIMKQEVIWLTKASIELCCSI